MPGGGFSAPSGGSTEFEAKITPIVIISCIMAATGGLMFGYDVGVSGGVTSMDPFLKKFFPVVYRKTQDKTINSNYCKYDNQGLQMFTSSLYLAGLIATFFASYTTRRLGRRLTMLMAGVFFIFGVVFNAAAQDLAMLIVGRILLGCGVGFANQAVPLFLSEIAPTRIRGGLNILFQLNVTIGILFANLINYGTAKIKGGWGWRLSLGLAGIPAFLLTLGALLVVDTPNSLIERGRLEEGKRVLRKIRGTDNIEPEFLELVEASRIAKEVKHPFRNLLKRRNRPQLVIAVALQIFQQFTGINAIMFYAPVLFNTLGFHDDASLYSAVITGAVNVVSTIVSIYSVDKVGRRLLLLEAGVQMFFSQVIIAILLGIKVKDHSEDLAKGYAVLVVIMVCTFVSAFAWSWGPLGWLIPSETFPLETRSAGQSITVCINLLFTFVIAQAFLSMLCHFKYGIFLFFSGWVLIMSFFVLFLLPETKNVPIEEMTERVWKQHWFWKRFMDDSADERAEISKQHWFWKKFMGDSTNKRAEIWKQHWFWKRFMGDRANKRAEIDGFDAKKNAHANGFDPSSNGFDPSSQL
ncbi:sugar transport protein 13-like [Malania oleifera]|uniref:sugar transport protein 13-like n=1 Tax=Malania oleifera TaxID=397392 RepID=UPI0025AE5E2B|nr:sugar transport protein 13-like [Malania oleifera]